ncbi:MAG: glycine cleavage system protein H [Hyphomicrobiales bacterium]
METLAQDPFATKGTEYLVVLLFLFTLPLYWRYLNRTPGLAAERARAARRAPLTGWFRLPDAAYYHAGHTWAMPAGGGRVRIGLDDFAQKILGSPELITLPALGARVARGRPGLTVEVGQRAFDLPSPIGGRVVARNDAVLARPDLVSRDPYGAGWLYEVSAPAWNSGLRSLLRGDRARAWLARAEDALRLRMSPEVGAVLQDGGVPVSGIARALAPEDWDRLARDLLFHE